MPFIPGGDELDDNDDNDDDDAVDDVVYELCIFTTNINLKLFFAGKKVAILLHLCKNNSQAIIGVDSYDR